MQLCCSDFTLGRINSAKHELHLRYKLFYHSHQSVHSSKLIGLFLFWAVFWEFHVKDLS